MKEETFKAYIDAERAQFVKEISKYPVGQYLSLRTAVDDFLIAFDQLRDKLPDCEKSEVKYKTVPKIVKSPVTNSAFEKDKEYEVVDTWMEFNDYYGWGFIIYNDDGLKHNCLTNHCSHIGGENWIIIE